MAVLAFVIPATRKTCTCQSYQEEVVSCGVAHIIIEVYWSVGKSHINTFLDTGHWGNISSEKTKTIPRRKQTHTSSEKTITIHQRKETHISSEKTKTIPWRKQTHTSSGKTITIHQRKETHTSSEKTKTMRKTRIYIVREESHEKTQ